MEEGVRKQSYKWCCVPLCHNTTKNTPNKIFIHVPKCKEKRKLWCDAARRTPPQPRSNLFCCEDHFDLEKDVANYRYYKVMGGRIFMKPSVVPHKFHCQPSWRRTQDQSTGGTVVVKEEKQVVEQFTAMEPSSPSISSRTSPDASTSTETVFVKVECFSPVDFDVDQISNGGAKRQRLLVDSSTEMGTSMPSNSSQQAQAASTSWTSVFIKEEPHSPVKEEEDSQDPLFNDKKRTTVEIGVQADIKPKYVSMATNCNLDSDEPN